jgi:hypothetical protein
MEVKNKITVIFKSVDTFCARLNAGLAAVALVLTVLVAAQLTVRMPDFFQQAVDAENANLATSATAMVPNGAF